MQPTQPVRVPAIALSAISDPPVTVFPPSNHYGDITQSFNLKEEKFSYLYMNYATAKQEFCHQEKKSAAIQCSVSRRLKVLKKSTKQTFGGF